jgi:hypothetical protein
MKPLASTGSRLETEFFLALADSRAEIIWHAIAQPINSHFGMLPGT